MASQQNWRRGFFGSLATLVACAIVVLGFGLDTTTAHPEAVPSPSVTATATPSATPTPSPSPSVTCDPRFVQKDVDHGDNGKVDAAHKAAIEQASAGKSGDELAKARINVLLDESGYSGHTLAIMLYANGLRKDPNDWHGLVTADGKCLSQEGIDQWNQLKGALSAAGTKVTVGDAPGDGFNTGVDGDKFVVAKQPGIDKSVRKATIITYPNGTVVYILDDCENIVLPTQPVGIPTSPKVPHATPQVPVTPLVPNVPQTPICEQMPMLQQCLAPKSRNIQDYQRPGTDNTTDSGTGVKPPVTANPKADPAPPKVVTSQPGGGGVVDAPTKAPGSETGGTAPGATAPEPSRSSPPAPEPGVNNPATGGNTGTIANPFGG